MARKPKDQFWADQVESDKKFVEKAGLTMAGYVKRYGSQADPVHTGSGGEAIWVADVVGLARCIANARLTRAGKRAKKDGLTEADVREALDFACGVKTSGAWSGRGSLGRRI